MNYHARIVPMLLLAAALPVQAQQRVDLRNTYERLLCVVPVIGSGTPDDPKRPLFAPIPGQAAPTREGIIAFAFQLSDDGKHALVEFVARDREGLKEILEAPRSDVKIFHKGRDKKDDVEKEFRKYRRDFDLERFGVSVP